MASASLSSVADPRSIARKMLSEDARWIADTVPSSSQTHLSGILPILLIGHSARIVNEGSELMRSPTPGVAQPLLARRLPAEHAAVIEKARHATKLFDDSARPYQVLLGEMDAYLRRARSEFLCRGVSARGVRVGALLPCDNRKGIMMSWRSNRFRII